MPSPPDSVHLTAAAGAAKRTSGGTSAGPGALDSRMMQFNPRTALQREKENGRSVARLMRKAARVRGDDLARQVG
jgi:hypothetical protein